MISDTSVFTKFNYQKKEIQQFRDLQADTLRFARNIKVNFCKYFQLF